MANAGDIELGKKHRKVLRCSFTKSANELDQLLKQSLVVPSDIEILWECLKSKSNDLRTAETEVYDKLLEDDTTTEEQLLAEMDAADLYYKRFIKLQLGVEKCLAQDGAQDNASIISGGGGTTPASNNKRKFLLPRIQFKTFDGDIREWLAFWSQFQKIHTDDEIDDSDKIEYLIQATVPGSRARQIVESFPVVGDNYQKIIDCLLARFGREDLQIEVYVRELLKLVLNNAMSQQKLALSELYDRIETQLRALDTLGITSDKYAALLFPLIESCLPQELLRIWQRSLFSSGINSDPLDVKLQNLMNFIRSEVENEQKIDLASEGFGLAGNLDNMGGPSEHSQSWQKGPRVRNSPVTAAGLVNADVAKCIFCSGLHESAACFKAQKMLLNDRKRIANEKGACFRCLKKGHLSRKCRSKLKCIICGYSHVPLMCQNLPEKKQPTDQVSGQREVSNENEKSMHKDQTLANQTSTHVFLQTLKINIRGPSVARSVRALIDSGSQRSYILKSTASLLGLKPKRVENIIHCLFGGSEVDGKHYCYDINIFGKNVSFNLEVLDQENICNEISSVFYGPWMHELICLNIEVSDYDGQGPIEVLFGADVLGLLYTGNRHVLKCGIVAYETQVGWTIEGKVPTQKSHAMTVMSFFSNPSITDLWQIDVLGIQEPTEKLSKAEMALSAKELFAQTVTVNSEGRYEVALPWLDGHPVLGTNYLVAKKRLESSMQKLKRDNFVSRYDDVFREWESMKIIERIPKDTEEGHFLPHRPVIKEGSTTAVRPVFDASAHERENPSLNQCLEKGPNLIELIPALLIKFREFQIGVISDIKKAFLQISVSPRDRQFLKFLWVDEQGLEIVYRHNRVVFGVNCSPFLLGATIEYHLSKSMENCSLPGCAYTKETIEKLSRSFYVDNCVSSVPSYEILDKFIKESTEVMTEAQFDLRGWEFTGSCSSKEDRVSVLGLNWYPKKDVITLNQDLTTLETVNMIVTKRKLLSMAQKIFDPIGFISPASLLPKIWLQSLWKKQISWDEEVDVDIAKLFKSWMADLPYLLKIEIPRWCRFEDPKVKNISIHTFVDASMDAYAVVVFSRVVLNDDQVYVYLLAAKSRVAPIRKLTIPRLELMAATIGARLYTQVIENLTKTYDCFFWSDSSTVIQWIQRNEEWGTFVFNRVTEIRKLTPSVKWNHIPGTRNPADLPSRGCSPKQLFESRWWEGPAWLYKPKEQWFSEPPDIDEEEVIKEKKRKGIVALVNSERDIDWHIAYFSKFDKTIRMMAYLHRFVYNCRSPSSRRSGELSVDELNNSEQFIFRIIQKESFSTLNDDKIKSLNPFYDDQQIIRLKSRVSNRPDTNNYRFPILLPSPKHSVIEILILNVHKKSCHVATQGLLCLLREKYWILGGRRAIRSVLRKCGICRRFTAQPFSVKPPPLPQDRVCNAAPFEITGVDFAGPMFLKNGEKAWICLFTCAVYRAIHLELVTSLSTLHFLQVLRRFVARRGRPKILYSDNGTNFRGADNAFANLDWDKITRETTIQRILWRFNPPSASWWGGFFERLIGMVKQLLRRVLGRASLDYEELMTLICDCESVINARPMTYLSSDPEDCCPLTPASFLREQSDVEMPDCDEVEKKFLSQRMRYIQTLRDTWKQRFRIEYLGQLSSPREQKTGAMVKLGQIVLVGNDCSKRSEWPIGRVVELFPGQDEQIRLVRVKMARGELLRPVQRLFPLECEMENENTNLVEDEVEYHEVPDRPIEETDIDISCSTNGSEKPGETSSARKKIESEFEKAPKNVTRRGRVVNLPRRFCT